MPFPDPWSSHLAQRGLTEPTDVQTAVWAPFLAGAHLAVQSATGTGKTLAYLLPLFTRLDPARKELQALILVPTQELAVQILRQMDLLTAAQPPELRLRTVSLMGGVNLQRQLDQLKSKPHVAVGTPGRVLELLEKKKITGHFMATVVLDEADRLLDDSSIVALRAILKTTLKSRQLCLFSASLPAATLAVATSLLAPTTPAQELVVLTLDAETPIPPGIAHWSFETELQAKNDLLRQLLHALKPGRALVFLNKPDQIELVASKLRHHSVAAESLHGTRFKEDRQKAMKGFASGEVTVLVASDLAARGLDIGGVTHVFHFDIPENPLDYQHRCGRTGRLTAGSPTTGSKIAPGVSVSLATEYELGRLAEIAKKFGITIEAHRLQHGKVF
ncbi:MAG: DEAD/DEAH box helicase [Spirochaetales bacterium]